jgi:hypothetical protein
MATNVSANNMLSSYALFNATDIKQFIIDQLKANPNSPFKDVDYLGSNINAFIDIIAVMLQQILFSYSVNSSETSFSTALLYENMSKIVSLLNYKSTGKQTSMLPVRITINKPIDSQYKDVVDINIPKFLTINYNKQYTLLNDEVVHIPSNYNSITYDTVLFQGSVHESQTYVANGDDFETIYLPDTYINSGSSSFISDNFFTVYVKENGSNQWEIYEECASLFLENSLAKKFERRFTEDFGYEFKFGNGTHGRKLAAGDEIIIYYLISDGEEGVVGSDIINAKSFNVYNSKNFNTIKNSYNISQITENDYSHWITNIANTGPSTAISYPESVSSIRKNAPKVFASQGRLFNLSDYETFIKRYFSSYCKDLYFCTNDDFTKNYLKYYYDIGLTAPQKDSRLNIAQVEFMTAVNFNNIYCFLVPLVNTIINGITPNYLNTALKKQIVNKCRPQMGISHNLVIIDPIYKAFTFGSYSIDDDEWNKEQLENKLVLVRNKFTKYSYSFIKEYCIEALTTYFGTLKLGSTINTSDVSQLINNIPGVSGFYIKDKNGVIDKKINFFIWNPLYPNEDNTILSQPYKCKNFEFPYFYDINNLKNKIEIVDE